MKASRYHYRYSVFSYTRAPPRVALAVAPYLAVRVVPCKGKTVTVVRYISMSRPSFRPRPLDIHQKLPIVRDPKELSVDDITTTRAVQHSHVALDKENDQVQTIQTKKGQHEIPIPDIHIVESYAFDVKPNYVLPDSYIRFGASSVVGETYLSYDLDTEDGNWLAWCVMGFSQS